MSKAVITNRASKAFGDLSATFSFLPEGNFLEKKNIAAAMMKSAPTQPYKVDTLPKPRELIWSSLAFVAPNNASATTIGPIAVPKELIPPPKVMRWAPVSGEPSKAAKGLAAVCCSEKPNATANRPSNIPGKVLALTATIMMSAPTAEKSRPYTILFLKPHRETTSLPKTDAII